MAKVKAYILRNLDGQNSCMAAAATLTEAAKIIGASVYYMRQMGWNAGTEDDLKAAEASPGFPLYRPIDNNRNYPWSPHRWHRDYSKPGAGWHAHAPSAGEEK